MFPPICVGPDTCCMKLNDSVILKKFAAKLLVLSLMWMLKSANIKTLSNLMMEVRKSLNSAKKDPFGPGGR